MVCKQRNLSIYTLNDFPNSMVSLKCLISGCSGSVKCVQPVPFVQIGSVFPIFFKFRISNNESAQRSSSHSLRSFNYLMQDAGIMLGHHLKESWAFIYRDGSGVGGKREVCLSAMKPADVFFKGTLICVSFFLCLWFLLLFLVACVGGAVPNIIFFPSWGAIKAQRRARVADMVDRSTWGKVPTAISHFSTCCSQDFTLGTCCIALTCCVSAGQSKVELSQASWKKKDNFLEVFHGIVGP